MIVISCVAMTKQKSLLGNLSISTGLRGNKSLVPTSSTLVAMDHNIFEFNGQLLQQIIEATIGAIPSCEACDILMYKIMKEILPKFKGRKNSDVQWKYQ
jgi:hypothetical protein